MARILVGSPTGLHEYDAAGQAADVQHPGRNVTALAREGEAIWAGLDQREVWRGTHGSWSHVADPPDTTIRCLAQTRAGYIVGTSEARLYRIVDNDISPVTSFDLVDQRQQWFTPWGGPPDTRSISEDASAVFVNVHVGGILRSRDRGHSWEPTIDIHADVHKVMARPGKLYAACARGLGISADQGDAWEFRTDGLHATYCRGVAVCGPVLLLSASTGPGGSRSALYRADLEGNGLEHCRNGLPEWFDDNIDSLCLDALPDGALAAFGTVHGQVFASVDQGANWTQVAGTPTGVNCVLVMP